MCLRDWEILFLGGVFEDLYVGEKTHLNMDGITP